MGHRVLAVEDDPVVSDVVRRYLEQDGYQRLRRDRPHLPIVWGVGYRYEPHA